MADKIEREGEFPAEVVGVDIIENRFHPGELEFRVVFLDADKGEGRLYLDMSEDYVTAGNRKGERQCDVTRDTLISAMDIDPADPDSIARMDSAVGKKISVFGKKSDKGYYNFYLNTRKPETKVQMNTALLNKLGGLFGKAEVKNDTKPAAAAPKQEPKAAPAPEHKYEKTEANAFFDESAEAEVVNAEVADDDSDEIPF